VRCKDGACVKEGQVDGGEQEVRVRRREMSERRKKAICERVAKRSGGNKKMLDRMLRRIRTRFDFICWPDDLEPHISAQQRSRSTQMDSRREKRVRRLRQLPVPKESPQETTVCSSFGGADEAPQCTDTPGCYFDALLNLCSSQRLQCTDRDDTEDDPSVKGMTYGYKSNVRGGKYRHAGFDYCKGNVLYQVSCGSNEMLMYKSYTCVQGCDDGVCVSFPL